MEYYTVAGMVVISLGVVIGIYINIKKDLNERNQEKVQELKEINELNLNVTKLRMSIDNMTIEDKKRDDRLNRKSKEIDEIKEKQKENEKHLLTIDYRLGNIEERMKAKGC